MIKLPKHVADCSFVYGDKSRVATLIISCVSTMSIISLDPRKMKFLRAVVPWSNRNISSDFLTKFIS